MDSYSSYRFINFRNGSFKR